MTKEVLPGVVKRIAEVLALVPEEIEPSHRLVDDLGAESLDLVELMFLLEQEFDITLGRDDMSLSGRLGLSEEEIHQDEVLTPRALGLLRKQFPWASEVLVDGITRRHLAALLTVEEVARAVECKLRGGEW